MVVSKTKLDVDVKAWKAERAHLMNGKHPKYHLYNGVKFDGYGTRVWVGEKGENITDSGPFPHDICDIKINESGIIIDCLEGSIFKKVIRTTASPSDHIGIQTW